MTVVEDFAADYFVVESLTPKRQREVLRALRRLEAFAGAAPETVDDLVVRRYVTSCVAAGMHVNTARKELHAIKPFFRWCWRQRIITADDFLRIKEVEPPRGSSGNARPRPYRRKELDRFWSQLDARFPLTTDRIIARYVRGTSRYRRVANHAMRLQTQAVVSLALYGGLRSAEIRTITLADIHPDNAYIAVRGKSPFGERQGYREVPYTEDGRALVGRWLAFRELLGPTHDSPWLVLSPTASRKGTFPSHPLDPISDDGWETILTRVAKGWELHRFRHTCATEWLRAGMRLERLSKLLGHANISQTLGYAELVADDVARDVRRGEQDFTTAVGRQAA